MKKSNRKKVFNELLIGIILIMVLLVIYLLISPRLSAPSSSTASNVQVPISISTPASTTTSTLITPSTPPTSSVSTTSSYQLTMPDGLLPLYPSGNAKLKIFGVSITKDGFSPSLIVVNQGDGVALSVKAVDGTYDVFFPAFNSGSGQIQERQNTFISFVPPKAGEYVFECRTYCPYGHRISGKVIVLSQ